MSIQKIKQLEELVSSVLRCLEKIYSENLRLEQRVQELENEKEMSFKENERAEDSLQKMKQLETSHHQLKKDCSTARAKIKNVLQKIEKIDFV
jgi:hypothetical protein